MAGASICDDPRVRIVDTRSMPHGAAVVAPEGRELYAAGHLPGAIHLDYAEDLHDLATPYAARVAPPERFADVMSENGIGDGTLVIAYDDGNVPYGARLVWMLRYYGHDDVAILAGGLPAWTAAGYALTTDVPHFPRATFTPRVRPAAARVARRRHRGRRRPQRRRNFSRRSATARTRSAIATFPTAFGSRRATCSKTRAADALADRAKLDKLIAQAGLDKNKRTIVSCGSGVGASGAYLALCEAGFTNVGVYDGSWMEWEHDELPTVPKRT